MNEWLINESIKKIHKSVWNILMNLSEQILNLTHLLSESSWLSCQTQKEPALLSFIINKNQSFLNVSFTIYNILMFGVRKIFAQNCLKVTVKTLIMLQNISSSTKCCSFSISNKCCSIQQRILELLLTIVIMRNVSYHHISILEWFLKDHTTLKTGVTAAKKFSCHHRNKLPFNWCLFYYKTY